MVATSVAEQPPATPEEIWAILRETAQRQREHEVETARWREEDAKRREEDAKRRRKAEAEDAKQREEDAERRRKAEAEDAKQREEDAERRRKAEAEDAKRWEEWAELKRGFAETKELFDRTDRQIERNNSEMGRLRNSFGEVIEHLVAPGIKERFYDLGLDFSLGKIATNVRVSESGRDIAEADLWLENGETILVVEVKAKVKIKDIGKHKDRLEKIRRVHDGLNDRRRIIGAMAGAVFGPEEREAALDAGFFVLAQTGDTMRMDIPEGFKPKEW